MPQNPGFLLHLGQALRTLRQRRDLSQAALAERCGLTPPMISNYERGVHHPSLTSLEALLHALGADLFDLAQAVQVQRMDNETLSQRLPAGATPPQSNELSTDELSKLLYPYLRDLSFDPMRRRIFWVLTSNLAQELARAD
ncbi:MAG: helix-turn-helix transcriptional regulator [Acidobacteriota bacterium]